MAREKIVCVEWDDASYNSGYYDAKDPERFEPTPTRTVGYLIKRDARTVVVSMDRFYVGGKLDDERHIGIIPRKMIKRIINLGEIDGSKKK